jgi:hypothetical protein
LASFALAHFGSVPGVSGVGPATIFCARGRRSPSEPMKRPFPRKPALALGPPLRW